MCAIVIEFRSRLLADYFNTLVLCIDKGILCIDKVLSLSMVLCSFRRFVTILATCGLALQWCRTKCVPYYCRKELRTPLSNVMQFREQFSITPCLCTVQQGIYTYTARAHTKIDTQRIVSCTAEFKYLSLVRCHTQTRPSLRYKQNLDSFVNKTLLHCATVKRRFLLPSS